MTFVDCHAHPGEMTSPYADYDEAEIVFGCSSRPGDWDSLGNLDDPRLFRFYGVHPWYADQWDEGVADMLEARLSADPRCGVGEIGLDAKRGTLEDQISPFAEQMGIAMRYGRPVQVHMVGCEAEMLRILRDMRPTVPVILHGFGNEGYAKAFAESGCYMSVGPRIAARSDGRIARLMGAIPADRLLLETDAPFTPAGFTGMMGFVSRLSDACGIPSAELLSSSSANARRIIDVRDG